jgi:hypothetical protein
MRDFMIRQVVTSEQKELEDLQLRASLTNAGDRDALLAHPDAIELPLAQIAAGGVFVAEWNGTIVGFAALEPSRLLKNWVSDQILFLAAWIFADFVVVSSFSRQVSYSWLP